MNIIWKTVSATSYLDQTKQRLFLLLNTLLFSLIGLIVWLTVGRLFAPGWHWLICFIGYPGYFIGYIGGIFYLYKSY